MTPLFKKIFFFLFLFSLLIPFLTWAITIGPPFELPTFEELINAILDFISWTALVIAPIAIIVAAFYFLTSGGDPEKVRTAKRIIFYTIVGLIIILLARGLPSLIELILRGPGPPSVCVPTVPPCNGICPHGCTVNEDPDCPPCQGGNGCCGIGCNFTNDNDCPSPPEICDNNIDDDGDTLIDCDDPDCVGDPTCPCPPNVCQDLLDLVSRLFGRECGDPKYDPIADVNKDGGIHIQDIGLIPCGNTTGCQDIWNNLCNPCVCQDGDGCCGIGCNHTNDNNCPPPVNFPPTADARVGSAAKPIATSVTVTEGDTVYFDGSTFSSDPEDGVSLSKYKWDFKDDGFYDWSSAVTGAMTYDKYSAGSYIARLQVTDSDGATATDTVSVTVNPAPILTASIISPSDGQIFLQGTSITFTGSVSGGVPSYTYSWNSNRDGAIGNTLTFDKSDLSVGVHTITFEVTDSAPIPVTASDSITSTITDDTTPPAIQNTQVNPTSGPSGTIFTITADIIDPLGVDLATTMAHIQNPDENDVVIPSLTLYDDGAHNDGAANDGTYGGSWDSTGFPEAAYYVDITACDLIGNCAEAENI